MSTGRVVFSLDFELGWGHRSPNPAYVDRLAEQRSRLHAEVRRLVDLFDEHGVPATWAVVGKLVEDGEEDVFHAPRTFEYLLNADADHDIGFHSHEHRPYDELTGSEARQDIEDGVAALQDWDVTPTSFVFPGNRVTHTDLLAEYGFSCYRVPPALLWRARVRHLLTPGTHSLPQEATPPIGIPSSAFLAARRPSRYRVWHALRGLQRARARGKLVHYWLHPHNVVTDGSLRAELETLLGRVRRAADAGEVQVETMAQAAAAVRAER